MWRLSVDCLKFIMLFVNENTIAEYFMMLRRFSQCVTIFAANALIPSISKWFVSKELNHTICLFKRVIPSRSFGQLEVNLFLKKTTFVISATHHH